MMEQTRIPFGMAHFSFKLEDRCFQHSSKHFKCLSVPHSVEGCSGVRLFLLRHNEQYTLPITNNNAASISKGLWCKRINVALEYVHLKDAGKYSTGEYYSGVLLWHYILNTIILPLKHVLINTDIYLFFQQLLFELLLCTLSRYWATDMMEVGAALHRMTREGLSE